MWTSQGRFTLLLGPPSSGKSTLLKALSNKLDHRALRVKGEVLYNGKPLNKRAKRQVGFVLQVRAAIAMPGPD